MAGLQQRVGRGQQADEEDAQRAATARRGHVDGHHGAQAVSMGTPPVPKMSAMAGRASTAKPSEAGSAMMPLMRSELKI